jgi:homoserine kinase type II
MPLGHEADLVLAHYPEDCWPRRCQSLGNAGGFSGAKLWRIEADLGSLCLRRWPSAHPSRDQLEFIQAVLWHVVQEGFDLVPLPLEAEGNRGYVEHQGYLWQLEPWLPGTADFPDHPTLPRLSNALRALGEFHLAASTFPLPDLTPTGSPGLVRRYKRLRGLLGGGFEQLSQVVRRGCGWSELDRAAGEVLMLSQQAAPAAAVDLATAVTRDVQLQPCMRDIWCDHVLFEGDEVSGLIDFGAMRPETVAGDVARLLGSLAVDDPAFWAAGMVAYESARPLTAIERGLVTAFDHSSVVMSGLTWLEWIYVRELRFEDRDRVLARVEENLRRLRSLASGNGRSQVG